MRVQSVRSPRRSAFATLIDRVTSDRSRARPPSRRSPRFLGCNARRRLSVAIRPEKSGRRPGRSPALINYDYDGAKFVDLLIYGPMISDLLTIGILWHAIQSFPGFLETVGYLFGMLAASFTLEAYWQSDVE